MMTHLHLNKKKVINNPSFWRDISTDLQEEERKLSEQRENGYTSRTPEPDTKHPQPAQGLAPKPLGFGPPGMPNLGRAVNHIFTIFKEGLSLLKVPKSSFTPKISRNFVDTSKPRVPSQPRRPGLPVPRAPASWFRVPAPGRRPAGGQPPGARAHQEEDH